MGGLIALVGSGEFTSAMAAVDRGLLAATGADRPRVAIVPTASWPDGKATLERWAEMGDAHFAGLGATPVRVPIGDLASADDPAGAALLSGCDLIYFSGGKPGHLLAALEGTAAGAALRDAYARGVVIAGCSAGAMVLGGHQLQFGGRGFLQPPFGWQEALGLVPGIVVLPHYDRMPEALVVPLALAAPDGAVVVGIDEETALVGSDGAWQVHGRGRVTLWRGANRRRYKAGSGVSF
jgi:cyanophycinase